jgi:hypothetical protein
VTYTYEGVPRKRRGRPPGSKNKKTLERERLREEQTRRAAGGNSGHTELDIPPPDKMRGQMFEKFNICANCGEVLRNTMPSCLAEYHTRRGFYSAVDVICCICAHG